MLVLTVSELGLREGRWLWSAGVGGQLMQSIWGKIPRRRYSAIRVQGLFELAAIKVCSYVVAEDCTLS